MVPLYEVHVQIFTARPIAHSKILVSKKFFLPIFFFINIEIANLFLNIINLCKITFFFFFINLLD